MFVIFKKKDWQRCFQEGEEISLVSPGLLSQDLPEARNMIAPFLQSCKTDYDLEILSLIIEEILTNYTKAIAKRIYFSEQGLNVNNPEDCRKAMTRFQKEVLNNWAAFVSKYRDYHYRIWVHFRLIGDNISIRVSSNYHPTLAEQQRIVLRVNSFEKFRDLNEAYQAFDAGHGDIYDGSKGTGLGIIVVINLLNHLKVPSKNIQFKVDDSGLNTEILIPIYTASGGK